MFDILSAGNDMVTEGYNDKWRKLRRIMHQAMQPKVRANKHNGLRRPG